MKTTGYFFSVLVMLFSYSASAQNTTEYELQHQVAETERQALVALNLPLLESEESAFWKLYREYRVVTKEMDDKRSDLLSRLAGSVDNLPEKEGNRMVMDALKVEKQRQKYKDQYLKKFAKVLPGQKLFRFYQIETKLDAILRFSWTSQIPLASAKE